MIFSEQWIREWLAIPLDRNSLVEQLTMAGLEVEGISPVAGDFNCVVVGEITAAAPHPNADKLQVCQVNTGKESFQVVCGASNARVGLKAPFALVDAELPGKDANNPLKIKNTNLRGVDSFGMLCSAAELGLSDNADGLLELPTDATTGSDLRQYLQLDDTSIELNLTPNRGDCLGIVGLAREIAALNKTQVTEPEMATVKETISDTFTVKIQVPESCPRYLGRVVRGVDINAGSPLWLQEKLRRCGLRSIDPIVDITNYVLLELGQPMHAFDLAQLRQGIDVRMARSGEELLMLDGKVLALDSATMVIADQEKVLAIAGVMGGKQSGVSSSTKDVFLECAYFAPLAVAGRARKYGLHTDSSHRYERGVDYNLQQRAMERATSLLISIAGGNAGPVVETQGDLPEPVSVALAYGNVGKILGMDIPVLEVIDILTRLGMSIDEQSDSGLRLTVPSHRFDIRIEADLVEELARVYGYNRLPKSRSAARLTLRPQPEALTALSRLKDRLVALGYQEVITYSFVEPSLLLQFVTEPTPVAVQNPISSDMSVMRTSLWPGLIGAYRHNSNRQQERIRIFESGQIFRRISDSLTQPVYLSGLIAGARNPINWSNTKEIVNFYDVKGDVESLLALGRNSKRLSFRSTPIQSLHPGQSAEVLLDGETIGYLGALHPAVQSSLDIDETVYLFELELEKVQQAVLPAARELSRFPEVSRDLAMVVDQQVSGAQISSVIWEKAGEYLTDLRIFDVYQGDAIEKSKKSIALGLTLQHPSRTLGDDDINTIINSCVKELEHKFNAKLRN